MIPIPSIRIPNFHEENLAQTTSLLNSAPTIQQLIVQMASAIDAAKRALVTLIKYVAGVYGVAADLSTDLQYCRPCRDEPSETLCGTPSVARRRCSCDSGLSASEGPA